MTLTPAVKNQIDRMTYEELLRRWRFSESDPIFQGESGKYYAKRMEAIRPQNHAEISKRVGWQK